MAYQGKGIAGQILTENAATVSATFQPGGGSTPTIFTKFTSNGTWTKNPSTKWVTIVAWGGGSGGGSGSRFSGTYHGGGGAGLCSGFIYWDGPGIVWGVSESVVIGAGGAGGAAVTLDNTIGNDGAVGGFTTIGNLSTINIDGTNPPATFGQGGQNGFGGAGGQFTTGVSPYYENGNNQFSGGGSSSAQPGSSYPFVDADGLAQTATVAQFSVGSGGAGGDISGADALVNNTGNGGDATNYYSGTPPVIIVAGGVAAVGDGAAGGAGNPTNIIAQGGVYMCGTGGGGGNASILGAGGAGGDGAAPGGSGGGGGASLNGNNSGKGGDGARGEVWIWEFI